MYKQNLELNNIQWLCTIKPNQNKPILLLLTVRIHCLVFVNKNVFMLTKGFLKRD